jgi:hypothetical protein
MQDGTMAVRYCSQFIKAKGRKSKAMTNKSKTPKFDRNKPRAICMKVRCAAPSKNMYGYNLDNAEKCGTVYLRIVAHEDNPTEMDLRTTHKKCPICGADNYERLTDWSLGSNGTRVVIHSKDRL